MLSGYQRGRRFLGQEFRSCRMRGRTMRVSSYELNRQRNNRINGCNCRGIAVMFVQCILRTDDDAK
jgi:hypothetical protein